MLDSLSLEYKHAFERLGEYKYDYGLAGTSDGTTAHLTSLVNEMRTHCDKIGENFFFLVIFDGPSNMQLPTKPLVLC